MPVKEASRDSGYGRYANAELQFRCLDANDSELRRPIMEAEPAMRIKIELSPPLLPVAAFGWLGY
ncbi:hypothetical protein BK652_10025 [Pseudomonas brassicacearum]|uniref:Uncharacterized protein n=1 Tax=Pseudomonas brassicacearum TaxID=930166 RepID=A0A423GDH8_9PSED|nr:hypothetical protein BK652_10025 [Pseudomonas brassicacearum]